MAGFQNRTVVVTGAGKGIGRATALMLARRGARVIAISRTQADLDSLAAEVDLQTLQADLADLDETTAVADRAMPADLLINCAGTTRLVPFLDTTHDDLDHLMAVNVRAPMILAQCYSRSCIERGVGGAIVNVSSVSSFTGFADHAAYCATKGALDAMSRVMANELGPLGIRVNTVNPVVTLTPMAIKAWSDLKKSEPLKSRIPMNRFVEPDEVAEAILFLLSDAASMINGISLPVDGGFGIR